MQAKIQAVLILLATGLKITKLKGGTQSEQQNCRASWRMTASVSTGLNARRAAGLTVYQIVRKRLPGRSQCRGDRERGGRRTRLTKKLCCCCWSCYTSARCCNHAEHFYTRATRIFFLSEVFGFIYIVFAVLLYRAAVLSLLSFIHHTKIRKKYPTWGMHVRTATAREAKRMWRPGCFLLAWRRESCYYQVASSNLP